jgi:FkbM family methyltransferase
MLSKRIAYFVRSVAPISVLRGMARAGAFMGAAVPGDATFPSIDSSLKVLSQLGFHPTFCVDVGAYHGEWTTMFKSVFPQTRVLMVEAQESKEGILDQVSARYGQDVATKIALLGPRDGEAVVFNEMETGSSVFEEQSPYKRTILSKTTRTLDGLLADGRHPPPDFLKLDVQGYELEVLKGATEALKHADALLLEASLVPINSGCPLLGEVVAFVGQAGFRLFDFCSQVRRADGVLWQTDLLFVREGSRYCPDPHLTKENWR